MTPQERIAKHEDLIKLVIEHEYIPASSQGNFGEVVAALREIDPTAKYDTGCSGCIADIIRMANVHLQAYKKKLQSTFHTFPNHKKKG